MPLDVVKCNTCNIVISELLAFVQNKIEVMDNESLIRICKSAFPPEDVDTAKILLFESVPTSKRKISRKKGDGKIVKDLEDIIKLFKETDPEIIPIFVAKDLYKLPPITFDHLDCSRLLKDILLLQSDMSFIKENYAQKSQVQELAEDLTMQKVTCLKNNGCEIPRQAAHACSSPLRTQDTVHAVPFMSPIAALTVHDPANSFAILAGARKPKRGKRKRQRPARYENASQCAQIETVVEGAVSCSEVTSCTKTEECVDAFVSAVEDCMLIKNINGEIHNTKKMTMSDVVRSDLEWKNSKPSEEWVEVQRRRYKNRFSCNIGKANTESNIKFKAADTKIQLFISNVHKDTTVEDIREYINQKTQDIVTLEIVQMKRDKGHNSFKLWVSKQKLAMYLDDKLWPEGISFRKFINFRPRYKSDADEVK